MKNGDRSKADLTYSHLFNITLRVIVIKNLEPLKELETKVSSLWRTFSELCLDGTSEPDHGLYTLYPMMMLLLEHRVSIASHTKSVHHIGFSSKAVPSNLVGFHVGGVLHSNHLYKKSFTDLRGGGLDMPNWEIDNRRLFKNYLYSAYRFSWNGTLWPVGHLVHFVVSRLVVWPHYHLQWCTKRYYWCQIDRNRKDSCLCTLKGPDKTVSLYFLKY